jgi:8-oxo-dGTP diphosphatase
MDVVAAVIYDGPRVLLTRRGPGRPHAGLWEFPGGKVEPGETHQQALIREIMEELSLHIQVGELLAVARDERISLYAYRAEVLSGVPQLRDHDVMEWALGSQLAGMEMPELDHQIRSSL